MKSTTKKSIKNALTFVILTVLITVNYFFISYVLDSVFGWFGGEENITWKSILITCAALSVVALISGFVADQNGLKGIGRKIIDASLKIILNTTILFGAFILLETIIDGTTELDKKTMHWLSLSISLGVFNYLNARRREREIEHDENMLVVAAECSDMSSAETLSTTLEANGIKTIIVEKHSPIYIKCSDAPVQIQVSRKDLDAAKSHIAK